MVDRAGGGIRFDTGIERIFNMEAGIDDARLPDLASILPSREQIRLELDEVVPESRLAHLLDAFLRPATPDVGLVLPHTFEDAFRDLHQLLAGQAKSDPVMAEASRLMADEAASRDLLNSYRATLVGA
jgi:hypothetical protein